MTFPPLLLRCKLLNSLYFLEVERKESSGEKPAGVGKKIILLCGRSERFNNVEGTRSRTNT
jgi:hypothetical protein